MNSRKTFRIVVPVGLGALSLGAALITPSLAGAQDPTLPVISRASLIAGVLSAKAQPFSGTVVTTSSLLGNASQVLSSVANGIPIPSGTATINLWYGGPGQVRAQLLNSGSERDLYVDGTSTWIWNSASAQAVHVLGGQSAVMSSTPTTSTSQYNPQTLATSILTHLQSTTTVSMGKPAYVGGQAAYQLDLTPTDRNSLFQSVQIFVDANTDRVLGINVIARSSSTPVFSMHFSALSNSTPSPSVFAFTPPSTAKVSVITPTNLVPASHSTQSSTMSTSATQIANQLKASNQLKFVGSGWSTVGVTPAGTYETLISQLQKSSPSDVNLLKKLFTVVSTPSGNAQLLSTPLLNVLVLQNGEILVGSVDTAELVADSTLIAN